MKTMKTYLPLLFSLFLKLIAFHSLIVGIGLIFFSNRVFYLLGFTENVERFFPAQGGTFHIIMAVCYYFAGKDSYKKSQLIHLTIFVKICASIFLIIYYIFINAVFLVLLSFATDFTVALIVIWFNKQLKAMNYFSEGMKP